MPVHVIINLAEETGTGTGVTGKVKDAVEEYGKKKKRHGFLWRKTQILQTATIHKYDLVDNFDDTDAANYYGIDRDVINDIRQKVSTAERVYYCAHGSATDRNNVFTQRGDVGASRVVRLASMTQFADFALKILPGGGETHDLRLIVCFAARSVNPDANHTRAFLSSASSNHQALKSSLAYKLYKLLDEGGVRSKMYARLGEVRVAMSDNYAMDVLTQTEAGVQAGLLLTRASAEEQRHGLHITDLRKAELRHYITAGTGVEPPTDAEQPWVDAYREFTRYQTEQRQQGTLTGQGRLLYEKSGTDLKISFEGSQIYKGAYF